MKSVIQYAIALTIVLSPIAQWKERQISNLRVEGSSPSGATTWVEYMATGYSHGCTKPRSGKEFSTPHKGANGKWPIPNRTVAADKSLPFGTILLISYRGKVFEMEVGDRGGSIVGKRIDIFFPTCSHAKRWGRRLVHIKVKE